MSKKIRITNELYEELKNMKNDNESFSKVIERNIEKEKGTYEILNLI